MTAPSNSIPFSVFMVTGEKALHITDSHMFVAINKDIPEPIP